MGAFCVPSAVPAPITPITESSITEGLFPTQGGGEDACFRPEDFPGWVFGPGEKEAAWELRASLCLNLPICAMMLKGMQGLPQPWHCMVGDGGGGWTVQAVTKWPEVQTLRQPPNICLTFKRASSEHGSQACLLHGVSESQRRRSAGEWLSQKYFLGKRRKCRRGTACRVAVEGQGCLSLGRKKEEVQISHVVLLLFMAML